MSPVIVPGRPAADLTIPAVSSRWTWLDLLLVPVALAVIAVEPSGRHHRTAAHTVSRTTGRTVRRHRGDRPDWNDARPSGWAPCWRTA